MKKAKEISGSKKTAFTLTETLITLAIIGIIASMTIQTVVPKLNEKTRTQQLKKTYSVLQQAFLKALSQEGSIEDWGISMTAGDGGEKVLLNKIAPHLKTLKICENGRGCYPNITYKNIDGSNYVNWNNLPDRSALILTDGTIVMFNTSSAGSYSDFGQIYVDINGSKPPNKVGIDFFYFYLFKNSIIPSGAPAKYGNEFFKEKCIKKAGFGCAAWVLYNENMEYLHCNDLSWDGKKYCNQQPTRVSSEQLPILSAKDIRKVAIRSF